MSAFLLTSFDEMKTDKDSILFRVKISKVSFFFALGLRLGLAYSSLRLGSFGLQPSELSTGLSRTCTSTGLSRTSLVESLCGRDHNALKLSAGSVSISLDKKQMVVGVVWQRRFKKTAFVFTPR